MCYGGEQDRHPCRQEIYMGAFIHYLIGFRVLPHKVMAKRKRSKM